MKEEMKTRELNFLSMLTDFIFLKVAEYLLMLSTPVSYYRKIKNSEFVIVVDILKRIAPMMDFGHVYDQSVFR